MAVPFYFLNIYKEKGLTSFDVIYKLRKLLNIKKIGHAGTLDPLAQGVMQVAVGSATRLLEYLNSDKTYIAQIKFGYNSITLDAEGEITPAKKPVFNKDELELVIKNFIGEITQIPPKFSAIKVNGKKLCDLARRNPAAEIEPPERTVKVYDIKLLEFLQENYSAKIEVSCSKGTYIRTLAQDIAKNLNTAGYLTDLTRTRAGNFEIKNSVRLENLDIKKDAIPPKDALNIFQYELNDGEYSLVKNGVSISINCPPKSEKTIALLYKKNLVSIGILEDNKIKIKKFFN